MTEITHSTTRIFISGACPGLAEARDSLASHPEIELVGTASDAEKAKSKLEAAGVQVVLHAVQNPEQLPTEELRTIREATSAPIILVAPRSTAALIEEAVKNNVSDLILLPQLADNLAFTVKKAHAVGAAVNTAGPEARRSSERSRVITLFSPKGGTGKTTLAANMGAMFAKRLGKRTLLIDLDLQFGDAAIVLGIEPKQTILDLVMSHGELDPDKVGGFVTHHESGLHLLPAPLRPEDAELINDERLASLLAAAKQAYDVVIIDTPPNFNSTVLTALDRTDDLLIVASLDIAALKNVKVCTQTLQMLHFPLERSHILLNRARTKVGLKQGEMERVLGRKVRFEIPSNRAVPMAVNRGVPVVMTDPKSDVSRALRDVCLTLTPEADDAAAATETKMSRRDRKRVAKSAKKAQKNLKDEKSSTESDAVDELDSAA